MLYFDTDSCYYIERKGINDKCLEDGPDRLRKDDLLGELTDELIKIKRKHGRGVDMVCIAPKRLAFKFEDGYETVKCKGVF